MAQRVFLVTCQVADIADDVVVWIRPGHYYAKDCLENGGDRLRFDEASGLVVEDRWVDPFGRTTREWLEAGRPGTSLSDAYHEQRPA